MLVLREQEKRVDPEKLLSFVKQVFMRLGVPEDDAGVTADVLVQADLRGIESHGVARISRYVNRIQRNQIEAKPKIRVLAETPSTLLIDGGNGLGQVVAVYAMRRCIEKANASGACFASVRNSNHFGIAGYYSMMALKSNMIGISMTNAWRLVTPTYGRKAMFGTNPISIAVPAKNEPPFVLDMATSVVPIGKIEVYERRGEKVPPAWGADKGGIPTTNPSAIRNGGFLMPLGGTAENRGYKGYGLAIMVDILSGVLSGAAYGPFVGAPDSEKPCNIGHFFGAIRIDAFQPEADFRSTMDQLITVLKEAPKATGETRIYVAGEKEFEMERKSRAEGIPLHSKVYANLRDLGRELQVPLEIDVDVSSAEPN